MFEKLEERVGIRQQMDRPGKDKGLRILNGRT